MWFVEVRRRDVFPGQFAPQKANENVGDGLKIVTTALLLAEQVVDRGIPGGAPPRGCTALDIVFQCVGVAVSSRHAEVNEVYGIRVMSSYHEVARRYVSVNEIHAVEYFYPLENLVSNLQDGL
eukprot:CAMPEP_0185011598 /NCGR_PEP_ID=MMETSP1098-20130426/97858_1 /TAXON_ID=89044 /ORGANISM="Spumella elongata, Strain CCAP 955/1" /LENGTH=122 /DNA_ID=CAMNT_0027540625 /DNA_START=600 /DNA_END=968 /DNA_ORIENTATION=-